MPKRPRDASEGAPSPPPPAGAASEASDDDDDLEAELERELAAAEAEAPPAPAATAPAEEERGGGPGPAAASARAAVGARNRAVVRLLTDAQLDRYEAYRRASISRPAVRRLLMSATGGNPSPHAVLLVAGIAKLFVAELVEAAAARAAAAAGGGPDAAAADGPLTPAHLRAAYADLRVAGRVPDVRPPRRAKVRL